MDDGTILYILGGAAMVMYLLFKLPDWLSERERIANLIGHANNLEVVGLRYVAENISPGMADMLKEEVHSAKTKDEISARVNIAILQHYIFVGACEKCIKDHVKVLMRKKKSSICKDDYGREVRDNWVREVRYFTEQILIPFLREEALKRPELDLKSASDYHSYVDQYSPNDIDFYADKVESVLESFSDDEEEDLPESGHDYERYVAAIFENYGFDARVTKGSGDHGADIIVDMGHGESVAVQCKHYSSPVGNKAVQEAYSAKGFYDADQAWVVASSSFTPAAKIAAQKLGVLLFHHEELPEILEAIISERV